MKRCPQEPCENCMWYRYFQVTNNETAQVEVKQLCGIEVILTELVKLITSVDGNQTAANQARNAVWSIAVGMAAHGIQAPLRALKTDVGERVVASLRQGDAIQINAIVEDIEREQIECTK